MSAQDTQWIAVDWGTTHMRAWVFGPDGALIASLSSADGMGTLSPDQFEGALLALADPYLPEGRQTPVIACGMVGARQGWMEAPYAAVPCAPPSVRQAATPPTADPRLHIRILPGVSQASPADVMRGEETQIAGYLELNPGFDGVICLPGTHTKWAHVSAGEIVSFRTFMTGELFALLSQQSVLRHGIASGGWDDAAFMTAVEDAMARPHSLAADLFSIRAAGLLNDLPAASARSRLSGLLIGLELAGARPYWLGQRVALIGADALSRLYETALSAQATPAERGDGDETTLAGLTAAYKNLMEGPT